MFRDGRYITVANKAYEYIQKYFRDIRYGGIYWELDYRGKLINDKKQIYNLAFCIYALSEYYRVSKKSEAIEWAIELYQLIEEKSRDRKGEGYFEAFTRDWKPIEDMRLSEKDLNGSKTMNTHLHIMEAYTNLLKIWPDQKLRMDLENLLRLFRKRFLTTDHSLHLFFNDDWQLLTHRTSFGHDIEYSWLACHAAEILHNEELLEQQKKDAISITKLVLEKGMDSDGGLMYEQEPGRGIVNSEKHWWPQAEAMVGILNAWSISGNNELLKKLESVWSFIKNHISDPVQGEWHFALTRDLKPITENEKAGFWKCPYHSTRALIEGMRRLS